MLKIQAISDIHGQLPVEPCPECDVLIIAGDICPERPHVQPNADRQADWLDTTFRRWLAEQPAGKILATWGNHDFVGQRGTYPPDLLWQLIVDGGVDVDGTFIYMTPWVPNLGRWAYAYNQDVPARLRQMIPSWTDIVVSHGPPYLYCDEVLEGLHVGSETLVQRLYEVEPDLVICGHIHEARGRVPAIWGGDVVNVASVDRGYVPYPERFTTITF